MSKTQKIIRNLLLAFVLVSIGFALGRHSTRPVAAVTQAAGPTSVLVYYLHSTFRCTTCNTIEKMTKALLERQFKQELASGAIRFSEVDFQKDEALSKQFGVSSSCVVVAAVRNGKVIDYRRLDEVWTLMKDQTAFDQHIIAAIAAMRQKLSVGGDQ